MGQKKSALPEIFMRWFQGKGWSPHLHQLDMLAAAQQGQSSLLIAPTGGGKTLAGFLPTLVDLAQNPTKNLHTIYISPLKALAADIERNLMVPITDMNLDIRVEMRTGDTTSSRRQRQIKKPPHILLTTPESLELLLSYPDAANILGGLQRVIIDEVHALAPGKRGHMTALCLTRLRALNPNITISGLSATVAEPERIADWLRADTIIKAPKTAAPNIHMLQTKSRIPWGGYMASYAVPDIYAAIQKANTSIIFVNTRAQAEWMFQQLWKVNENNLSIALHHGSLDREHRLRVEANMATGNLRAIVATASLDLGLDWGAVDLVIQIGAPKGISRLLQRIGRSNHHYNVPSEALLVPCNRFETLECIAVMEAIDEGLIDGDVLPPGSLDVLAQYVMNCAVIGFDADNLYQEIITALPYRHITREIFDQIVQFLVNGGYALKAYDRFQRLFKMPNGEWVATREAAKRHRLNIGTIVEYETLRIGLRRGRSANLKDLGQIEEYFIQMLAPGDTFLFAGQLLKFIGIRNDRVEVERGTGDRPKIPSFKGGRLPLSLTLADRVLKLLEHESEWARLPPKTREWLELQKERSVLPSRHDLLVETFPHEKMQYMVLYTFTGRNANQTLGLLLSMVMEQSDLLPLGFVASDHVLAVWGLRAVENPAEILQRALSAEQTETWIAASQMSKRAFRDVAIISGLVERRMPGKKKTGRQVTVSTDLIYDVLRKYDPDHILLKAAHDDVIRSIADTTRLRDQLLPLPIRHQVLKRLSPLAVPMILEVGIEKIKGGKAEKELLTGYALEQLREAEGEQLFAEAK